MGSPVDGVRSYKFHVCGTSRVLRPRSQLVVAQLRSVQMEQWRVLDMDSLGFKSNLSVLFSVFEVT